MASEPNPEAQNATDLINPQSISLLQICIKMLEFLKTYPWEGG